MYTGMRVYVYMCICIFRYIYIYVNICIYTHIYINNTFAVVCLHPPRKLVWGTQPRVFV